MTPPMHTDLITHLPDSHRPQSPQERTARRQARAKRPSFRNRLVAALTRWSAPLAGKWARSLN